jgi:putative heme-binding domain-containing protein
VLESIVAPSAAFASGFEFRRVRDRDGRERVGRLVEASADSIVLEGEGGERVEIKRVDIAEASVEPSGMPPLGRGLSPRQLRDVLAFVVTLGRAEAGIQNELRERR